MSEWAERILSNPLFQKLDMLKNMLDGISITPEDPPEVIEDFERLKEVTKFIELRIKQANPILITPPMLNNMDSSFQNMINEVNQFNNNKDRGHLTNANQHADHALQYSCQLPSLLSVNEIEAAQDAVTSFRLSALNYLKEMENKREETNNLLLELTQKIEDTKSAFSKRVEEENSSFTNQIEGSKTTFAIQIDQVNAKILAQEARLDNIIATYQEQFSQAESKRRDDFDEDQKTRSQKFEQIATDLQTKIQGSLDSFNTQTTGLISDSGKRFDGHFSALDAKAQKLLETLEEYRIKAEGILNVTGSAAMAGDYQKVANRARTDTYIWQVIVAISMVGLIGFAIYAFKETLAEQIKWGTFGGRVFVTVAFGILAAWAVSQVNRYQEIEMRNRRFQLELSSIEPYLVGLPPEMKNRVKVELSQKLFGNTNIQLPVEAKKATGTSLDLVQLALTILQEAIKKSH